MIPESPATAEGELGGTPFAHLAVYALDKRISGELFLSEPSGTVHVVRYENGTPVKLRVTDDFLLLGEILKSEGLVEDDVLTKALEARAGLLGDMLVLSGVVESDALETALKRQFRERHARLFSLPNETSFKYFEGSTLLAEWGGEDACFDPMHLMWDGVMRHGECSTLLDASLSMLGENKLRLHPKAPYYRFDLPEEHNDIVELLTVDPSSLGELCEMGNVPEGVARKLAYLLLITRQLDLGKGPPVGTDEKPTTLSRIQLKSAAVRVGAAVEDAPGEGERTPIRPLAIRRSNTGKFEVIPREEDVAHPPDPPSDVIPNAKRRTGGAAPISSPSPETPKSIDDATAPISEEKLKSEVAQPVAAKSAIPNGDAKPKAAPPDPALLAMDVEALCQVALEKIDGRDGAGALEACKIARSKEPENREIRSLAVWGRALSGGADLKALVIQLDEVLQEGELSIARVVRGTLRKKLGDDTGALADFRHALESDPRNARAQKELTLLEENARPTLPPPKPENKFLKRLFGR